MKSSYIFGRNPVIEAINAGIAIEKIYFEFGVESFFLDKITRLAKKNRIQLSRTDKRKFKSLEKSISNEPLKTQGVIALLAVYKPCTLSELIDISISKGNVPVIVALDEISDPQNLGAIARSAECSAASGLILTSRESSPVTPAAVKASAGALEHLPVVKAGSLVQAMVKLKEEGFFIAGTDMNAVKSYTEIPFDIPLVLVIGSESTGIRQSTRKHCDILVKIPMYGNIGSLNASVSAGIILFDILRRKNNPCN